MCANTQHNANTLTSLFTLSSTPFTQLRNCAWRCADSCGEDRYERADTLESVLLVGEGVVVVCVLFCVTLAVNRARSVLSALMCDEGVGLYSMGVAEPSRLSFMFMLACHEMTGDASMSTILSPSPPFTAGGLMAAVAAARMGLLLFLRVCNRPTCGMGSKRGLGRGRLRVLCRNVG